MKAGKETHKVSAFVTDANGHQHEIMADVEVKHQKGKFFIKIAQLPMEVSTSIEAINAIQALLKRANQTGKDLLEDFQTRTAPGGRQMTIFDMVRESSGQTDDEDGDEDENEFNFQQGESA